jgi:dTDP-4-dehydrorhamnose 3,5-epimerase
MTVVETGLPGVIILESGFHEDARGFFMETYSEQALAAIGVSCRFVQDNHSFSCRNALRGLHYQLLHSQAKLCRVAAGAVLDVAVDIRRGSPTFGKWVSVVLSDENRRQVFIPRGFAHGFLVLSDGAHFLYKCDDYYHRDDDHGIVWNDPDIGIDWGIEEAMLSDRDRALPLLSTLAADQLPVYREA